MRAHNSITVTDAELARLTAYLREIGSDEAAAPAPAGGGSGLAASYFNNTTLAGTAVLTRTEAINFDWGYGAPGAGVSATAPALTLPGQRAMKPAFSPAS